MVVGVVVLVVYFWAPPAKEEPRQSQPRTIRAVYHGWSQAELNCNGNGGDTGYKMITRVLDDINYINGLGNN